MADPTEFEAAPATIDDRRRPGRVDYRNAHLIRLLRSGAPPDSEEQTTASNHLDPELEYEPSEFAPIRGMLIGLALSAPFWAALIGVTWLLLT